VHGVGGPLPLRVGEFRRPADVLPACLRPAPSLRRAGADQVTLQVGKPAQYREVLVAGDRIIVRGQGSGTPSGAFLGIPASGKSFKIMSIDIHTIEDGKIQQSYHLEDWAGAMRQLSGGT